MVHVMNLLVCDFDGHKPETDRAESGADSGKSMIMSCYRGTEFFQCSSLFRADSDLI